MADFHEGRTPEGALHDARSILRRLAASTLSSTAVRKDCRAGDKFLFWLDDALRTLPSASVSTMVERACSLVSQE